MKKLIFILIFSTVCFAQVQTDEKETLKQINQNVISSYKNEKMDEALQFARQAVDLSVKIYGTDNRETATAYTNLGIIYRERKKYKESIENLQTAADIYQKLPNGKDKKLIEVYEAVALSQLLDGRKEEAESSYLKAADTAETKFGKESKETFLPTLTLANFYARYGQSEKADTLYLKSYALAIKNFGEKGKEVEEIGDSRICFTGQNFNFVKDKAFNETKDKLFGNITEQGTALVGKAKSLPKPAYPAEARAIRLSGTAPVRVVINEQGDVVDTKSICRNDVLGRAAAEAAKGAKFTPTLLDGKPTKTTGIIVYSFIAPR